jgi:hypothetical protein
MQGIEQRAVCIIQSSKGSPTATALDETCEQRRLTAQRGSFASCAFCVRRQRRTQCQLALECGTACKLLWKWRFLMLCLLLLLLLLL